MSGKGMSRGTFGGKSIIKRGTGGMSKHKVYCILKDNEYVYFPVAAHYSPYSLHFGKREESYLAGMPNFFGGNMEDTDGGNIVAALSREIEEESQGRIKLEISVEALGETIFKEPEGPAQSGQDTYEFYILNLENRAAKKFIWESENIVSLHEFVAEDKNPKAYCAQYEDSFLVRMPINQLRNLQRAPEEQSEEELKQAFKGAVHELLGSVRGGDIATPASISRWEQSHTSKAFAKALRRLCGEE